MEVCRYIETEDLEYTELISGQLISSFSIHLQSTGLKEPAAYTALDLFFKQRKFWLDCEMAIEDRKIGEHLKQVVYLPQLALGSQTKLWQI